MEKHKYYDIACRAYNWTSFNPEKRAISECEYYDSVMSELPEWAKEKFTRLFLKSLNAKSRCASPMIAGPARFPVARMEKYRNWEENATREMFDFVTKATKPPSAPRKELDYKIDQKEYEVAGVKVVQNVNDNRLQLFFEGKPENEMITKLKKNGFKWSPRNKAWQRQLTPNAINYGLLVLTKTQST